MNTPSHSVKPVNTAQQDRTELNFRPKKLTRVKASWLEDTLKGHNSRKLKILTLSKPSHAAPRHSEDVEKLMNAVTWLPGSCKDDDTSKHLFKTSSFSCTDTTTLTRWAAGGLKERFRGSHVQTVRLCAPNTQPWHEAVLVWVLKKKSVCVILQRVSWGGRAAGRSAEGRPRACTVPDSLVWSVHLRGGRDLQPRTECGKDPPAKENY